MISAAVSRAPIIALHPEPSSIPLRLMLLDDSAEARWADKQLIRGSLVLAAESGLGSEAVTSAQELKPDVLLVALEEPVSRGLHTIERLAAAHLEPVVVISSLASPDIMRRAMLAGARDYLLRPIDGDELARAVEAVYEQHRRRHHAGAEDVDGAPKGEIITVFGAKGGIGRTTLAINLGVSLARDRAQQVVLVDLDLQLGDVALMLNQRPDRTIADLAEVGDKMDPDMARGFLTLDGSGLHILAAPLRPEEGESVNGDDVTRILDMLRRAFDYVVVDAPRQLSNTVIAALDAASMVCLVTSGEIACLKSTRLCLDMMQRWGYSKDKVKLVVNQAQKNLALPADDAQSTLDYPIFWKVPYDDEQVAATQAGQPVVQVKSGAKISKNIAGMARVLSGADLPARSFLPWRRR